jgi:hypothetical protein
LKGYSTSSGVDGTYREDWCGRTERALYRRRGASKTDVFLLSIYFWFIITTIFENPNTSPVVSHVERERSQSKDRRAPNNDPDISSRDEKKGGGGLVTHQSSGVSSMTETFYAVSRPDHHKNRKRLQSIG